MNYLRKIHVLEEFESYLRIIQAYNFDSVEDQRGWRCIIQNIFCVICATIIIIFLPIFILLGVWYLIENDADLRKFVAALPILTSLLQMEVKSVALMIENRTINKMIGQLQRVVDQRKHFRVVFFKKLVFSKISFRKL